MEVEASDRANTLVRYKTNKKELDSKVDQLDVMGPRQADTKDSTSIQLRYCMVRYSVHAGRLLTHTRWACKAFRVDPAQHESLWHRTSYSTTNKY